MSAGPWTNDWYLAGTTATCLEGAITPATAGPHPVAIYRISGAVFVTADRCPACAGRLSDGTLDGEVVACDCGDGRFRVATGEPVGGGAPANLHCFPVMVVDDEIFCHSPAPA